MSRALLTGFLLYCAVASPMFAADWPQWRGPNRDGRSSEPGLQQNWDTNAPRLLWMVDGVGQGYASVAVVDGTLFTTGNQLEASPAATPKSDSRRRNRPGPAGSQGVVALNAKTGERLWSTPLTKGGPDHNYPGARCTPTVDGELLYVVTSDGSIACLQKSDGALVWQRDFQDDWNGKMMSGWGYSESPLVDGDTVLCTPGGRDAMVVKLNKLTGEEIWRSAAPKGEGGKDGAGYSSIVISNAGGVKQYVQIVGRGLIGIRAEDGQLLWSYDRIANGTANIPTPIPVEDYVFASTGYRTGACLLKLTADKQGGVDAEEIYFLEGDVFQNHHGGMVRFDDYVYAGHQHGQGFPTCLNWRTGEIVWGGKQRGPGSGSAAVTAVGNQLLFRYQDGTMALIEATPDEYRLLGTFTPEYQEDKTWSHPVVVDGLLYLREQDKLMCYDVRDS